MGHQLGTRCYSLEFHKLRCTFKWLLRPAFRAYIPSPATTPLNAAGLN